MHTKKRFCCLILCLIALPASASGLPTEARAYGNEYIFKNVNSGLCLGIKNDLFLITYAKLVQERCIDGSRKQRFYIDRPNVSHPYNTIGAQIKNKLTGLCVDIPGLNFNGGNMQLYPCNGGVNQRFDIQDAGLNQVNIVAYESFTRRYTGYYSLRFCADVENNSQSEYIPVQSYKCKTSTQSPANQIWDISIIYKYDVDTESASEYIIPYTI